MVFILRQLDSHQGRRIRFFFLLAPCATRLHSWTMRPRHVTDRRKFSTFAIQGDHFLDISEIQSCLRLSLHQEALWISLLTGSLSQPNSRSSPSQGNHRPQSKRYHTSDFDSLASKVRWSFLLFCFTLDDSVVTHLSLIWFVSQAAQQF